MVTKIVMPRLSLTMKTGSVVQWFKKEGETVLKGESLVEVLSEKVTYDVEVPTDGILRRILVEEAAEAPVGATLALIALPNEELPTIEVEPAMPTPLEEATIGEEAKTKIASRIVASPAAKRIARIHKVDLTQLEGIGSKERITEEDVRRFIEERTMLMPRVKEEVPLVGIRKTTAERVSLSFHTAPHSFLILDVDMTKAVKLREQNRISYTATLVYAVAKALREHPNVNSTLTNGKIQVYEDINIGVAVSTERGLIVPVIRKPDEKQLSEISVELRELVEKARHGELSKQQLSGGTFTITNLGMYDVNMFFPIINPPEAAILAAGRVFERPVAVDKEVEVKPFMTLTLAYDHRIIDGAPAAIFLKKIKEAIEMDSKCES